MVNTASDANQRGPLYLLSVCIQCATIIADQSLMSVSCSSHCYTAQGWIQMEQGTVSSGCLCAALLQLGHHWHCLQCHIIIVLAISINWPHTVFIICILICVYLIYQHLHCFYMLLNFLQLVYFKSFLACHICYSSNLGTELPLTNSLNWLICR